ncbi:MULTISPECIES: DUF1569 domain-containing protein [Pseudomonas]|uniref:DUF1569 domain-containing protein n=1 Tax=Pseudomonas solani TaxID=2731552 RepID=A0AAU7Y2P1_9PSED|nr:DUF1569 domain-containing protein [Pseudomonas sp. TUM22785]MBB4816787.1 hypothetical protein [Pseudomonas alcaligenes]WCD79506.1 DUF1569 domain-containing protein [Pseudomonas sp. TUM22785]
MNRRQLLKFTALAGVAGAGAGFWALPRGPRPGTTDLADAQRVLAGLVDKVLVSTRGWSPAEVFNHCAQSIEYSMSGYPELKPAWFRGSVGPVAFGLFTARGAMRHPLDEAIPGARPLDAPASQAEALGRLQLAFADFAAYQGELKAHFAYGALSHEDYARAHVMHLYDHLSLIHLA